MAGHRQPLPGAPPLAATLAVLPVPGPATPSPPALPCTQRPAHHPDLLLQDQQHQLQGLQPGRRLHRRAHHRWVASPGGCRPAAAERIEPLRLLWPLWTGPGASAGTAGRQALPAMLPVCLTHMFNAGCPRRRPGLRLRGAAALPRCEAGSAVAVPVCVHRAGPHCMGQLSAAVLWPCALHAVAGYSRPPCLPAAPRLGAHRLHAVLHPA